jgi:beta-lactamase superfamily II metal-dependent hydrolase
MDEEHRLGTGRAIKKRPRKNIRNTEYGRRASLFVEEMVMDSYGKLVESLLKTTATDTIDVPGDLVITFIDIGQGNCTFVQCPGGETILIDCGSVTKGEPKNEIAAFASDYIKKGLKANTLDYLIISHPDKDHMNLVDKVLAGVKVGKALCGGSKSGYSGKGKDEFAPFVKKATGQDLSKWMINGGKFYSESPTSKPEERQIHCKHNFEVFIVSANADQIQPSTFERTLGVTGVDSLHTGTKENTSCIVLCLRYAGRQVLICGDATFSTEYTMLKSDWGLQLKSYALEGGHHGSADSFSDAFLKAVAPSWIHFSADNKGTFRHPTWETVNRVITCCPEVCGSMEYGPHGIVIGPKMKVGMAMEKKGGHFIAVSPRINLVLQYMTEKTVDGKTALQALLPKWFAEGEWKQSDPFPPTPIKEQWVLELLNAWREANTMDNELTAYWATQFDSFAEELKRLVTDKEEIEDFKYYWDWSTVDFNLFTTLTTANLGVYWILTIKPTGEVETDLA